MAAGRDAQLLHAGPCADRYRRTHQPAAGSRPRRHEAVLGQQALSPLVVAGVLLQRHFEAPVLQMPRLDAHLLGRGLRDGDGRGGDDACDGDQGDSPDAAAAASLPEHRGRVRHRGIIRAVELRERVLAVLRRHWVDVPPAGGYTAPNRWRYPWQWLWDSCFCALIWAELGDDRGIDELEQILGAADSSGCVPHMAYQLDPRHHEEFWGRAGASSITGPPMYGHALAELRRRGAHVPDRLVAAAEDGLEFLLQRRHRHVESGLVLLCHPWESGADNDPRWDDFCDGGFDEKRWFDRKGELLATIQRSAGGAPLVNPKFAAASAGFSALVAFNALELAEATGALEPAAARRLADAVADRWDGDLRSYTDAGDAEGGSGRARTAYGLLSLLVETDAERAAAVAAELTDTGAHGGPFGPTGVHRAEPSFAAGAYWRGPSWPQLDYLLWLGLRRAAQDAAAATLAQATVAGAEKSGLAEYWDSDDGTGLGAVPQSWAGLALLMA